MPRKFSTVDKKEWLEKYESGKSEASIASGSRCDIRTIRRGIEEARRERDAQAARVEVLKHAVLKHQERLVQKLEEILSALALPAYDWAVLSWYQTGASILTEANLDVEDPLKDEDGDDLKGPGVRADVAEDMVDYMLKQHLRGDKLWKLIARRERAYASHRSARLALQCKVVKLLEARTGCDLEARGDAQPPSLCSYTAGELCYRIVLGRAFGEYTNDSWQDEIVVDMSGDHVVYRNSILAHVPGKAGEFRENLVNAFREAQVTVEVTRVQNTYEDLATATLGARRAIEEVKQLGLVPGACNVCRRLGM